jgi:trimeric autotransporter adhesin
LVPTTLGGVQVLVNGYAAPLLYVSATQINAVVPYEIAGLLNPTVQVEFLGQPSNAYALNAAATAPGIFTANGSGTGPGAIFNSDNSSNVGSAAARGTVVQVFLTGEGQTSPAGVDGEVTAAPCPAPLLPIAITVGGAPANYEFAGEAPGLVAGTLQLNVIIPPTLTVTGNVPLVVTIGSASTQAGVTVNIK